MNYFEKGGVLIKYLWLAVFVPVAVFCDIRSFRIPNLLNGIGCAAGLTINYALYGPSGIIEGIKGMLLPVCILAALFIIRVIGAGDIKLFCAIGASVGFSVGKIIAASFLLAGACGAVIMAGKFIGRKEIGFTKIHMSVPIAAGTLIYVVFGGVI